MQKKLWTVIYLTIFVFFVSVVVYSQINDPKIPRSWWDSVRDYIRSKSESKIMSLVHYGEPTDQVIGVFTPHNAVTIQRIDVYARARVDSDTTAFVMTNGRDTAVVVLDSSFSATLWHDSTEVIFEKFYPCTLKFNDDNYSGTFISGADTPMVVIQYKLTD
ncbi:hypothetical protein ACFL4Z_03005 [candidate division KSB1 bacterium]